MQKLRIVVPAVFATGALLLTGCSSSDSGSGSPAAGSGGGSSSSPSASPSPTDGAKLVTDATGALGDAESFHISGNIVSGSDEIELDITYGSDDVAQGSLDGGSNGTIELRRVSDGTVYAKGSAEFYEQDDSGPDLSSIADKWVVVGDDAPDVLSSAVSLLDRDEFVTSLEPDNDSDDTYDITGPEDVDGTSAYIVTDKDGSTFAVAAEGDPLPIEITNSEDEDGGKITFDGYGDDVTVDAPDDGDIVEIPA